MRLKLEVFILFVSFVLFLSNIFISFGYKWNREKVKEKIKMKDLVYTIFRIIVYFLILFLICTFIFSKFRNNIFSWNSFTSFESKDGILWLLIIMVIAANFPRIEFIIEKIVKDKLIDKFSEEKINNTLRSAILNDKNFLQDLSNGLPKKSPPPGLNALSESEVVDKINN